MEVHTENSNSRFLYLIPLSWKIHSDSDLRKTFRERFRPGSARFRARIIRLTFGRTERRAKYSPSTAAPADMALTRGLPAEDENGRSRLFALLVQPDWVKVRWRAAVLRNAKLYCRAWEG